MSIVVTALLGVLALVVVFIVTTPEETSPPSTEPLVAPTTTTPTSTTSTPTVTTQGTSFARQIPNVDGVLYAAVNGTSYSNQMRLFQWADDAPATDKALPRWNGSGVEFNATGDLLAFLGGQRSSSDLFVGAPDDFQVFRTGVDSFAWHHNRPGELAWTEASAICSASVGEDEDFTCLDYPGGELIGYDDGGYLVRADGVVTLLDPEGIEKGRFTAEDAEMGPLGRVLLVDIDESGDRLFSELETALGEVRPLPWAPVDALGEIGFVDWSPVAPLLAFLRYTPDGEWLISVFHATGGHLMTSELPGRFWDVSWDTSGVHVVAPGIIDEETHVVLVLNILTGESMLFPHPDWVQDAVFSTGRCIDATLVTATLTNYLVTRAGSDLPRPRAVLSLDPNLESWLFVSGRVSDGPRHGEIATWALPGFAFSGEPAQLAWLLPVNDVAEETEPGIDNPYHPEDYGFTDWMDIDGARESQACVAG